MFITAAIIQRDTDLSGRQPTPSSRFPISSQLLSSLWTVHSGKMKQNPSNHGWLVWPVVLSISGAEQNPNCGFPRHTQTQQREQLGRKEGQHKLTPYNDCTDDLQTWRYNTRLVKQPTWLMVEHHTSSLFALSCALSSYTESLRVHSGPPPLSECLSTILYLVETQADQRTDNTAALYAAILVYCKHTCGLVY